MQDFSKLVPQIPPTQEKKGLVRNFACLSSLLLPSPFKLQYEKISAPFPIRLFPFFSIPPSSLLNKV